MVPNIAMYLVIYCTMNEYIHGNRCLYIWLHIKWGNRKRAKHMLKQLRDQRTI